MKTSTPLASWARPSLLAVVVVLLSSCAMPPRQAWNMIQRDGLFNYWTYAATGQRPYPVPRSSPPLMSGSLAYRPPHERYGESWNVTRPSTLPQRSYSPPPRPSYSTLPTRYSSPVTPQQRIAVDPPRIASSPRPPVKHSSPKPKSSKSKSRPAPRIDDDEDKPSIAKTQPPPSPKTTPSGGSSSKPASPAAKPNDLPYGSSVAGRANMVNSPYASKSQLVDVAGMSAGQTVKCPYSGKLFKVPPTQQAAAKTESKLEPKEDKPAPKSDEKPKSEEKKP